MAEGLEVLKVPIRPSGDQVEDHPSSELNFELDCSFTQILFKLPSITNSARILLFLIGLPKLRIARG